MNGRRLLDHVVVLFVQVGLYTTYFDVIVPLAGVMVDVDHLGSQPCDSVVSVAEYLQVHTHVPLHNLNRLFLD